MVTEVYPSRSYWYSPQGKMEDPFPRNYCLLLQVRICEDITFVCTLQYRQSAAHACDVDDSTSGAPVTYMEKQRERGDVWCNSFHVRESSMQLWLE